MIPKIIHQTYPHKHALTVGLRAHTLNVRLMNPGWEYRFYDDHDIARYIFDHYGPEMLDVYNKINPRYGCTRTDLFRYLVVYREGGAYFDIKSGPAIPLDEIIKPGDVHLISQWDQRTHPGYGLHPDVAHVEGGEYENWHVIAQPNTDGLRRTILRCVRNIRAYTAEAVGVGQIGALRVTGPIAYTLALLEHKPTHDQLRMLKPGLLTYLNVPDYLSCGYKETRQPVILE